jgi:hypothetical protein
MKEKSKEWLHANIDIWERQKQGNHKHLNDTEAKTLQAIAKEIHPERHFTIYSCSDCLQNLIKFVFTNLEKIEAKAISKTSSTR